MSFTTLISAEALKSLLDSQQRCMVFDCSFDLNDPEAGPAMFVQAHITGAVYAHLDHALSAKSPEARIHAASGGRHPLPSREAFAQWLNAIGFSNGMQAVVYDRQGANYCGRLWWMLKWAGHDAVAVLDGGLQAWQSMGGAVSTGAEVSTPTQASGDFTLGQPLTTLVTADELAQQVRQSSPTIVDARANPRFRGEVEPLDPVAVHIPGALNRPFQSNLGPDGRFKPADRLRSEFAQLLGPRTPQQVIHHCGSGVSAIPNVLAMEIAGWGRTALFAGSWSEWCSDPQRPVAQG